MGTEQEGKRGDIDLLDELDRECSKITRCCVA